MRPSDGQAQPLATLAALDAQGLRAYCVRQVAEARAAARRHADAGRLQRPGETLRQLSAAFDELLTTLFAAGGGAEVPVALVALGGYGRRSLYPYSDIDLLVLPHAGGWKHVDRLLEHVVYPLWDAKVAVGHAVRSIEETVELARTDLTMRTALLDARLVTGDDGLFTMLQETARRAFFGPEHVASFVESLIEERRQRHPRFGDTVYLLEPNIKSGSGGLRDVNTAFWATKMRYGVADLDQLVAVGAASSRQQSALLEARQFLRRLRLAMHFQAGRAQDRLLFELQEGLAPLLFAEEEIPGRPAGAHEKVGVAPAVERLMHAYYRSARSVVLETDSLLQRCAIRPSAAPLARELVEEDLWSVGGELVSAAPERFWDEPAELIAVFEIAGRHGLGIARELKDMLAEAAASCPGLQLLGDERAAEAWRRVLVSDGRAGQGLLLEQMHEVGLLNAMLPEFEPCTGRVQHDLYHVYTVDRHSLYVVGLLKALRRGEQEETYPLPVAVIRALEDLEPLYLAALLHDVGKPLGRGHARKGARLAAGVAARLGLRHEAQDTVAFLVRHHLAMQHISQRRDLGDPAVVGAFAELVGSADRLRRLYLLAVADTAMTAPGNLTFWKASLLDQLYTSTHRLLTSGSPLAPQAMIEQRRAELRALLLESWGELSTAIVDRLPDELLSGQSVELLAHHVGVALDLEATPACRVRIGTRQHDAATTVITVCCPDAPGLLATITGVMLLHRIEVLAAQIYTIPAEGDAVGSALDLFWVTTPDPAEFRSWVQFSSMLELALGQEFELERLIQQRMRPSLLGHRVLPAVPTAVIIDNEGSERCTILELHSADVSGLLHTVTHTLSELGLGIDLAKVASEAGHVVDIFYVRETASGRKLEDEARLTEARETLTQAIDRLVATAPRIAPRRQSQELEAVGAAERAERR
ncbi:MAG: [protein-PII] uridylyltransferase [Proteobacteria bacterium]|nr:[protein-PII] uridylyltransferase [Pseudomonadota bacterium]